MSSRISLLPGFAVAVTVGFIIWLCSSKAKWVDPLVAGILCGMLLRTIAGERKFFAPGLDVAPKVLIPAGIILYGANLHFNYSIVPPVVWLQVIIGVVIVVWLSTTVERLFKLPDATSLLLAVGTAICGASAIIIASDAVDAKKSDTATSILVITFWGLIGLFTLPFLATLLDMNVVGRATLYATTLHQTGFVKAAAIEAGEDCLRIALAIKAARVVMIIPLLLLVGTLHYIPYVLDPTSERKQYKVRIPWYLWLFVISGLCFTFVPSFADLIPVVNKINTLVWTMAMVSIGLTVDVKSVIRSIGKPLLAGLILWMGLILVFLYTFFNSRPS